jgi:uncharacterized protein
VRIRHFALCVGMVAGLTVSGTARAESATPPALSQNPIYRSGPTTPMACAVPAIRRGSLRSLKSFHRAMADCADRFWAGRFKAAGLPYSSPKVEITTGSASTCGRVTTHGAQYCPQQRTVVIRVMRRDLTDPFRMNIAHSVAHEWGHHVQELSGILDARTTVYLTSSAEERTTLSHRLEMQAECFAGAFYSSTLESIGPGITWAQWIQAVGDAGESRSHGRPRNLAYWQNRGYTEAGAGACNTWTAPRSRVS